jgi:predicted permease
MEAIHGAWQRIKALVMRRKLERDLRDEVEFHLAMREARNRERGMNDAEARQGARRKFGNATRVYEQSRRLWTFTALETWWADGRYALRMLRKTPVMTLVVVVSLALGIGANTAIFSVLNAALLKSLPVPEPQRLELLIWTAKDFPKGVMEDLEGDGRQENGVLWSYSLPSYAFEQVRDHSNSFDNVAAFAANPQQANIGLEGHAEAATVQAVSGDFFQAMRVIPERGRLMQRADDSDSAPPVAMVSDTFWRTRMGSDEAVAGKTISINGQLFTVIGVLPQEFYGLDPGNPRDVWITLAASAADMKRSYDYDVTQPKVWWLGVIGRLKPGVTAMQAGAETSVLFDQALRAANPQLPNDNTVPKLDLESAARGLDGLRRQFSTSLFLLMAMVGLVLLIACANVASLLLARATARQREIAVRLSLGAARWRVIRQLLTESVVLALIGAGAGLLFARWVTAALMALLASGRNPVELTVHVDGRVLLFTAAVSVVCGVLFGLAPALRVIGVDVFPVLKMSPAQVLHGSTKFRAGKVLVAAQVALCLLLLVGAGLLGRTLLRLERVQLGFDENQLVSFSVQPGLNGYKDARLMTYYAMLRQRLEAIPGVRSVALAQMGPVGSGSSSTDLLVPGYTSGDKRVPMYRHVVGAGYFKTLRIPVLLGRAVDEQDTETTPLVATVNERAVREYFHGDDPVGHMLDLGTRKKPMPVTVVGVVADVKYNKIREETPPTMYVSYRQKPQLATMMTFFVRVEGEAAPVMSAINGAALAVDKNVPVMKLRTETEVIDSVLMMERLMALLSSMFGGLALLLACVGLYGTIGYTVVRRTNEIGVRMALGARRETIVAMVLGDAFRVVAVGLLVGLPLAFAGARLLRAQLFELSPHDPLTLGLALGAIVIVAGVSGLLPARKASRVDPMVALRCE